MKLSGRFLSVRDRSAGLVVMAALLGFAFAFPLAAVHAQSQSSLVVASQNTSGSTISGYYTVLYQGQNEVSTGFTPASFALDDGAIYVVQVDNYGSCNFANWSDTGSTSASRQISISSDTQITAVYNCGGSSGGGGGGGGTGGGSSGGGASSVVVNSQDTSGNSISGYYTVLYDSSGNEVSNGFTPATFSTTSGLSYSIQVDNYGSCSFAKWSDGVTSDPRGFSASGSMTFTAVYNCGGTIGRWRRDRRGGW